MSKSQRSEQATSVAVEQSVSAPEVTVAQPSSLRARRIAAVQVALHQKRLADKQARYTSIHAAWVAEQQQRANAEAFQMAVQQLAAQYGIAIQPGAAPRANSATVVPSSNQILVEGQYYTPCKAVHALAAKHQNRKDTLAACAAAGINPATAATQWGVYKKQHGL